ncbi:MAG: E3 ubiquitin ligase family protein [Sandaracinaceae bacterium]|nr:E3 ubiquitin ligase family protein [Sandaracinaceae bacterium]
MELFLVIALVVVVVVGLAAMFFSEAAQTRRAMLRVPRSNVSAAIDGELVRLVGRVVELDPALDAPLSHRRCVAFRVLVETKQSTGKSSHWVSTIDQRESVRFVLEDESGRARIEAAQSKLLVELDEEQGSGFLNDATPELEAYLAEHGKESTNFLGLNKSMRYREGVLALGETVAVLGVARWEDDPDAGAVDMGQAGFRDAPRKKRLVLEPANDGLYASDDPAVLK